MITVVCPLNNQAERRYIIRTLLYDFLGLETKIIFSKEIAVYEIHINKNIIIIEDHFFNKYPSKLSYLNIANIPDHYSLLKNTNVQILYGTNVLHYKFDKIICGLDIFGSSFFMLTRWEEFVLEKKSGLRCNERDLFAVKHELCEEPLVNKYLNLLADFFSYFSMKVKIKKNYEVIQTHDVDRLYLSTWGELMKNLRKILMEKSLQKSIKIFFTYLFYKLFQKNPFDTFDEFMDFSDSLDLQNRFYFKACNYNENGATYTYNDFRTQKAISNILRRGHLIGFHPSENTFQNSHQFRKEYQRLSQLTPFIKGGRQHNLIYSENTLDLWAKFKLVYDSGMGYQFRNGFRCGICYPFQVFDIFQRKRLSLIELPFVLMDTVFIRKGYNQYQMMDEAKRLIKKVKTYNGTFCTIWHTNLFNTIERSRYKNIYFNIIHYALNVK